MSLIKNAVTTTAQAVGFAKGLAASGVDVVRRRGAAPVEESHEEPVEGSVDESSVDQPSMDPFTGHAPESEPDLPGPDIVLAEPPRPEDLPEPVVIEADDHPGANGEAFQTEPKATTRADASGGFQGDVFESKDEAEVALEDMPEQR